MVIEKIRIIMKEEWKGLNPCFCGRWSLSSRNFTQEEIDAGLNPCFCGRWSLRRQCCSKVNSHSRLNPCFCGRWSLSLNDRERWEAAIAVLILVFVEDGH